MECICAACGAGKDLPLGRCTGCGRVPAGEERELAVICSTRVLSAEALRDAGARIRRGEPVRPTAALRARARDVLSGVERPHTRLGSRELAALVLANLLLSSLVGYALWWRYRGDDGPAARQALLATVPVTLLLLVALVGWRYAWLRMAAGG